MIGDSVRDAQACHAAGIEGWLLGPDERLCDAIDAFLAALSSAR